MLDLIWRLIIREFVKWKKITDRTENKSSNLSYFLHLLWRLRKFALSICFLCTLITFKGFQCCWLRKIVQIKVPSRRLKFIIPIQLKHQTELQFHYNLVVNVNWIGKNFPVSSYRRFTIRILNLQVKNKIYFKNICFFFKRISISYQLHLDIKILLLNFTTWKF